MTRPIKAAELATAFGVTPQAINGWRKKGRIGKDKLIKLARLTGRPAGYFLGEDIDESLEAQAFKLAADWLSLKNPKYRDMVRETLDRALDLMARFPELEYQKSDEEVARHIAPAGKSASVKRLPSGPRKQ